MCTKAGFTWVGDNNADATGPSKGGNCIASPQVCPDKKSICFNQQSYSGYGATCTAAGNCACAKSGYTWVAISKSEPFGDCVASESVCPDRRTYCQVVVDTALGTNASTSCNLSGKCTCAQPDRTWIFIYETKGTELVGQCMGTLLCTARQLLLQPAALIEDWPSKRVFAPALRSQPHRAQQQT
eukprot:TRINITY_DN1934_c0_g1_i3.p2 TRINITY_DN1934_c0_g1~~TRINITY_DN1934_c0_g1_i3.p2  ORF type:complete len:184 (-),score=16.30 TRINITY_DN1934_c0_g1_i3:1335-1886(-)